VAVERAVAERCRELWQSERAVAESWRRGRERARAATRTHDEATPREEVARHDDESSQRCYYGCAVDRF